MGSYSRGCTRDRISTGSRTFSSLGEHGSLLRRYLYPTIVVSIYFWEFEETRLCQLQVFVLSSIHLYLFVLLADSLISYVLCMYLMTRTKSYIMP